MTFLSPGLLWALAALSIPVLIHLFNFQRTERIFFANTRILREVAQQTKRARNLKNWLLLASRLLALAFLILAFAQPVLQKNGSGLSDRGLAQVAVYLDNSQSMNLQSDGKSTMDQALESAKGIPTSFGKKGWFKLTTNQFDRKHGWTSAHGFENQLTELGMSGNSRNFATVVSKIDRELSSQNLGDQKRAYYLSDFQKSTLPDLASLQLDSTQKQRLVVMQHARLNNVFIDSVWLSGPIALSQKSHEMKVKLRQSGDDSKQPVNLQLFDKASLESGKTVSFSGQPELIVSLPFRIKANETKQCTLTVNDGMVTFDNQFYITLTAPPPTSVLLVDNAKNPYLKSLFSNSAFFSLRTELFSNIDFQTLKQSDLVILNQPENLDEALTQNLQEKLKSGGSVWLIPSTEKLEEAIEFLQKSGLSVSTKLNGSNSKPEEWKIKFPDKANLFYADALAQTNRNVTVPYAKPSLEIQNGNVLLQYENGAAALVHQKWFEGKLFVQASPFLNDWGNFHQHALVVPTAYKIAFSASASATLPLYYTASAPFAYLPSPSGNLQKESAVKLSKDKGEWMANQTLDGTRMRIDLPGENLVPGFYTVSADNQKLGVISLNRDKAESVMDFYTEAELKSHFANQPWVAVNSLNQNDSSQHAWANAEGFSLWKYCILASILMFVTEMALARTGTKKSK